MTTEAAHRRRLTLLAAAATALAGPAVAVASIHARPSAPPPASAVPTAAAVAHADAVYRQAQARAATAAPSPAAAARARAPRVATFSPPAATPFIVGFDKQSLDPSAAQIAEGFHLGGYGIFPTRQTTGPLLNADGTPDHLYVRAMSVSNGTGSPLLLAELENQGTFASYKQCACGIWDIRQQVATDLRIDAADIVVNSDHSHSGPDLIGLWGGVPVDYLQYVHDQTVRALENAYHSAVPAQLLVGSDTPQLPDPATGGYLKGTATPGEDFVHSQFGMDTATGYDDGAVDTQLRVLQAVDAAGRPLGTLVNYAAHATVTDSSNLGYSADWPGHVAVGTEQALGEPVAVVMVADVGRSQPPRPNSDPACDQAGHPSCDADKLATWARLFTPFVATAAQSATPVAGDTIASDEVFTREQGTNGALLGASYSGDTDLRGYGAYRGSTPPWLTGSVIGTFVSAHRIGDILLTAAPGEAYPDVRFGVLKSVRGYSTAFTFGLANDQLGYLIAPTSEYGWITASQPGNDNALFNVAAQYGDHVYCTQVAAATAIGFATTGEAQPYGSAAPAPPCSALTASDAAGMGPAPQPPWPFAGTPYTNGIPLPSPFPQ